MYGFHSQISLLRVVNPKTTNPCLERSSLEHGGWRLGNGLWGCNTVIVH